MHTSFVIDEKHEAAIVQWLSAIDSEIAYWNDWFEIKGLRRPEDYSKRTEGNMEFAYPELIAGKKEVKVLDVGAGPISCLGNITQDVKIQLFACDPLAFAYKEMLDRAGVKPYVISDFALTERLCDAYPNNSFDIVNMTNALDHAINPLLGVYNMLAVCKKGGSVTLNHRENEAEFEHYTGLHKWNISEDSGDLILWNKSEYINVTNQLGEKTRVIVSRIDDRIQKRTGIFVNIIKNEEITFSTLGLNIYDRIFTQVAFYAMSATYREIASNIGIIEKQKSLGKVKMRDYLIKRLKPFVRRHRDNVLVDWAIEKLKPVLIKK